MAFETALLLAGEGFCVFPVDEWHYNRDSVARAIGDLHENRPLPREVVRMVLTGEISMTILVDRQMVIARHRLFNRPDMMTGLTEDEALQRFEAYYELFN